MVLNFTKNLQRNVVKGFLHSKWYGNKIVFSFSTGTDCIALIQMVGFLPRANIESIEYLNFDPFLWCDLSSIFIPGISIVFASGISIVYSRIFFFSTHIWAKFLKKLSLFRFLPLSKLARRKIRTKKFISVQPFFLYISYFLIRHDCRKKPTKYFHGYIFLAKGALTMKSEHV